MEDSLNVDGVPQNRANLQRLRKVLVFFVCVFFLSFSFLVCLLKFLAFKEISVKTLTEHELKEKKLVITHK